ncbi:hypothetical protein FUA23_06600 [Neolewinella aurantiaca]|uniref:DUF5681 domain-containing protein n=1 Tax=Neolewinella aurantiaca TaxID=2602767 RepID=A0A5C7FRA7_9BACT|nr:DUF5681 domain-containing protein [Neolewinella aurantiaca]TXF90453.1 hypothetical protein FUA23_06600 [Neolewinella aurantiaca]
MPFVKGQSGNPAGRKPKKQDKQLIDRLTPFDDEAFKQLEVSLKAGERWAIKMFFEYRYGKPTQRIEQNGPSGGPATIDIRVLPGPPIPTSEDDINEDIQP